MASSPAAMSSAAPSSMPTGLPAGVTAPWLEITDNNQAGLIAIMAAFSISLVVISFPIRVFVRSKVGTYRPDDWAWVIATVFAICQAATIFLAVHRGLGMSEKILDGDNLIPLEKALYGGEILYVVTLFFSKCSTAFLFLRLTPGRGHFWAIWITIALSIAWAIISIFLVALRCHPQHPWTDATSEICPSLFPRWLFAGIIDILTEIFLFSISIYLIWGIQMAVKSKTIVVFAFGCRLPVIALASTHLYYLQLSLSSSDPTLVSSTYISCMQLQIGYSIMASIIPCLKTFMAPYEPAIAGTASYFHSQYDTHTHKSMKLSSIASTSEREIGAEDLDKDDEVTTTMGKAGIFRLRPENTVYEAKITVRGESKRSVESGDSQRMIIKKGVEWSVDYDIENGTPRSRLETEEHAR